MREGSEMKEAHSFYSPHDTTTTQQQKKRPPASISRMILSLEVYQELIVGPKGWDYRGYENVSIFRNNSTISPNHQAVTILDLANFLELRI